MQRRKRSKAIILACSIRAPTRAKEEKCEPVEDQPYAVRFIQGITADAKEIHQPFENQFAVVYPVDFISRNGSE